MTAQLVPVSVVNREAYVFETPFGMADLAVGVTTTDQVTVTLSPNAAHELARIVAQGSTVLSDNDPDDVDAQVWCGVVVDLLASAAMCGPRPEPVYASGYLLPKGRRV